MDYLQQHLEALIFCAEEPVTISELQRCMAEMFAAEVAVEHVQDAVQRIINKYEGEEHVFHVAAIAGGYQFLTKAAYQPSISLLLKHKSKKRLSTSALETLSIVAYRQPITKGQIEAIRGVNCDYAMQRLLERELVEMAGKSDGPGRPVLYRTGKKFMDYFGIMSMADLPQPKDLVAVDEELGPKEDDSQPLATDTTSGTTEQQSPPSEE